MSALKTILALPIRLLSSLGLTVTLLILLGLLTWLGTLEQQTMGLFDVQKKYFESLYLTHDFGSFSLPLPGANLVLGLLFCNILVGGLIRLRKGWNMAGVMTIHIGMLLLMLAGFIKWRYSEEGHVTLFEGESADYFQSYHHSELVVQRLTSTGRIEERSVPQAAFDRADGRHSIPLVAADLPFTIEVKQFFANSMVLPKGPMFEVDVPVVDGYFLQTKPRETEAEFNIAGAYVDLVSKADGQRRQAILWNQARAPFTLELEGEPFAISLRRERYDMPFSVALNDFKKEDHPRMTLAKSFSSDVTVIEQGVPRPVHISMNNPLRDGGLVLFQASWGPSNARPGDPLFSTFAVVRNPADKYPFYALLVIAAGLIFHFSRKLYRYVNAEMRLT